MGQRIVFRLLSVLSLMAVSCESVYTAPRSVLGNMLRLAKDGLLYSCVGPSSDVRVVRHL